MTSCTFTYRSLESTYTEKWDQADPLQQLEKVLCFIYFSWEKMHEKLLIQLCA